MHINFRVTKDLRERLDKRPSSDWSPSEVSEVLSECSVFVTAALLKDFLRSLPDCLLMCQHYRSWVGLAREHEQQQQQQQQQNKAVVDPVKR